MIPTKTSRFVIQSSSREGSLSRSAACHVSFTSFLMIGFWLYIVAMWWLRLMRWSFKYIPWELLGSALSGKYSKRGGCACSDRKLNYI